MKKRVVYTALLIVFVSVCAAGGIISLVLAERGGKIEDGGQLAGVVEIWHIENFEGGTGSRSAILTKAGARVTARHPQVFFLVRTVSEAQAEEMLAGGHRAGLVSFSYGTGSLFAGVLGSLSDTYTAREDYSKAGRFEGRQIALPYTAGGYVIFGMEDRLKAAGADAASRLVDIADSCGIQASGKKKKDVYSLSAGAAAYNNPYKFLSRAQKPLAYNFAAGQYEAYEAFMQRGQSAMLLGTQRDVNRISARVSQGTMHPYRMEVFSETDLLQFVGVTAISAAERKLCLMLVEELYTKAAHEDIRAAGMLTADGSDIYGEGDLMDALEEALKAEQDPISIFSPKQYLIERKEKDRANIQ